MNESDLLYEQSASTVVELITNLDDLTGEHLKVAMAQWMAAGALDVVAMPAMMKKGRMGYVVTVICQVEDEARMAHLLLKYSTAAGVRVKRCDRYTADYAFDCVTIPYGTVRIKCYVHQGEMRFKPEADEVMDIAIKHDLSFQTVHQMVIQAYLENKQDIQPL